MIAPKGNTVKSALKNPTRPTLTRKALLPKIGKLIREFRIQKGFTQKQAAKRSGCSLEFWKRYEKNGVLEIPTLLKIAVSLDASLSPMMNLLKKKIPRHLLSTIAIGDSNSPVKRDMNLPEIESYLRKETRPWVKKKLQALAWRAKGMKVKEVGKLLGCRQDLIKLWLGRYYKSGIGWVLTSSKVPLPIDPSKVRTE